MQPYGTITIQDAAAMLGVSPAKMRRLINQHGLATQPNPRDRRQRLVSIADLEPLLAQMPRPRPQCVGIVADGSLQSTDIEEFMREHWRPWEH
jgi:excisionase family DNA binding protein